MDGERGILKTPAAEIESWDGYTASAGMCRGAGLQIRGTPIGYGKVASSYLIATYDDANNLQFWLTGMHLKRATLFDPLEVTDAACAY
jgi:hypothetical protein